jgi:hypothetical protein
LTARLDRAIDFLSLSRDLVGKCNFPPAAVSLEKAEAAVDITVSEMAGKYASGVQNVKEQIPRAIDELTFGALKRTGHFASAWFGGPHSRPR